MKIQPVASPHAIQTPHTSNNSAARDRAINMVKGPQTQSTPIPVNANSISVEEIGAVKSPTAPPSLDQALEAQTTGDDTAAPQEPAKRVETPEETAASRQFAQLAKREKQLRQRAQQQEDAYKAREAQLQAKEAELNAKYKNYDTDYIPKAKLQSDTLRMLAEAGIPYDQITQQLINETTTPRDPRTEAVISELKQQIQELRQATEAQKTAAQDQQTQQYQAAVKQIQADVNQLVFTDPAYETIKATNSMRDVTELIEQTYKEEGRLLSVEEACTEVENYLFEETYKLTQLNKIKSKLSSAGTKTVSTAPATAAKSSQPQQIKTLTNNVASSRPLTAKERAMLAFRGELKS